MSNPWAWTRFFTVGLTLFVAAFCAWGALAPHIHPLANCTPPADAHGWEPRLRVVPHHPRLYPTRGNFRREPATVEPQAGLAVLERPCRSSSCGAIVLVS